MLAAGTADVFLSYLGMIPEWQDSDAAVQFDNDSDRTVRETVPGLGHPLELRAYRHGGVIHVDWWYDEYAGCRLRLSRKSPRGSRPR